jgi:hypothetical protein
MEPKINASEFETATQLAVEIRDKIRQLYVDCVWVKFIDYRQKITISNSPSVCKGLMMADQMIEDQKKITTQDVADTLPPRVGWEQ